MIRSFRLVVPLLLLAGCNTGSHDPTSPSQAVASPATAGNASTQPATSPGSAPTPPATGPITTFATGLTPTVEVFVSPSGSDSSGDGSQQNPFASVRRGVQAATPGTAVRVQPGTYAGGISLSNLAGTPGAPIWIGGVPGAAVPVISGGNTGIQLSEVRYVVLHDLEITGAALNGINCDDGGQVSDPEVTRHVVFQNLSIHDVGSGGNNDGLKLSGLDDFFVLDCSFARVSAGSGIDQVGCHDGVIARCSFEQMGSNSIQLKGGSRNVEVRWCSFVDAGERGVNIGGSTGDPYFRPPLSPNAPNVEATEIRVLGNVFVGGTTPFAFVGATNSVAAHNTVVDPQRWLFRILQERTSGGGYTFTETSDCRVVNTIFYFTRASVGTDVNVGASTQPGTFVLANNLYYAHDDPAQSQPSLPVAETGTVIGDPGFSNVGAGDVSIGLTSPARAAGSPQALLAEDSQGTAFAPAPSIGAYEAQ